MELDCFSVGYNDSYDEVEIELSFSLYVASRIAARIANCDVVGGWEIAIIGEKGSDEVQMTFGLRKSANRLGAVGPARANYFCCREFLNYFIFLLFFFY